MERNSPFAIAPSRSAPLPPPPSTSITGFLSPARLEATGSFLGSPPGDWPRVTEKEMEALDVVSLRGWCKDLALRVTLVCIQPTGWEPRPLFPSPPHPLAMRGGQSILGVYVPVSQWLDVQQSGGREGDHPTGWLPPGVSRPTGRRPEGGPVELRHSWLGLTEHGAPEPPPGSQLCLKCALFPGKKCSNHLSTPSLLTCLIHEHRVRG